MASLIEWAGAVFTRNWYIAWIVTTLLLVGLANYAPGVAIFIAGLILLGFLLRS